MDYKKLYEDALERAKNLENTTTEEDTLIKYIFPEFVDDEDERIRKRLVDCLKVSLKGAEEQDAAGCSRQKDIEAYKWGIAYLEKQKDANKEYWRGYREGKQEILDKYAEIEKQKEQKQNIELIQRSWYMEGYHDREFGKEPKWILKTGEGGPKYELNPRYGELLSAEQLLVEKPINWTELTWKDIVELEGIINNVHYEFRNGIGQESFGKEVLEKFREYKGDEYLDGIEQKPVHTAKEMWKEMRLEVYAQASGNRHEPNYSDDSTKMFSLCDIDEIFEKIGDSTVGSQPAEWSEEDERMLSRCVKSIESSKQFADSDTFKRAKDNEIDWIKNRLKFLRPKKNISYGELPLVSIDYMERLDTYFEKQVGAVIASAMNREYQFTSKHIKWTAQRLMECARDKRNSEEEHVSDNKEWSEEDEKIIAALTKALIGSNSAEKIMLLDGVTIEMVADWLKSLYERFNLQPKQRWSEEDIKKIRSEEYTKGFNDAAFGGKLKEWSKEDENIIEGMIIDYEEEIEHLSDSIIDEQAKPIYQGRIDFLKRLKTGCPQPHTVSIKDATKFGNLEYERGVKDGIQHSENHRWKPSEEQMAVLKNAIHFYGKTVGREVLESLYNDLKKL